jgi:hypothetical protein
MHFDLVTHAAYSGSRQPVSTKKETPIFQIPSAYGGGSGNQDDGSSARRMIFKTKPFQLNCQQW